MMSCVRDCLQLRFKKVRVPLAAAGYNVAYTFINTLQQGLPQNRPRLYMAALRNDATLRPFKWPKPCATSGLLRVLDGKRKHDAMYVKKERRTLQDT